MLLVSGIKEYNQALFVTQILEQTLHVIACRHVQSALLKSPNGGFDWTSRMRARRLRRRIGSFSD
jgi:hypothetical protein